MSETLDARMLEAVRWFRRRFDGDEFAPRAVPLWTLADDLKADEEEAEDAARRLADTGLVELTYGEGVLAAVGPMLRATDAAMTPEAPDAD